jgi:hypothetical protein
MSAQPPSTGGWSIGGRRTGTANPSSRCGYVNVQNALEQGNLMKVVSIAIMAALLAFWPSSGLKAARLNDCADTTTVRVDRPSPPPCCADGLCFPKTNTWGYYQGQWRRWPGEGLPPAVAPTPAERVPGIPPFQAPSPQEEDQRAPQSTAPAERPAAQPTTPLATPPGTTTPDTTEPGAATPPAGPPPGAMPPGGGMLPSGTPEGIEPAAPSMPFEQPQPTGEWDPPPTLPFGTAEMDSLPGIRTASKPVGPQLSLPNGPPYRSSGTDSPPSLPLAISRAQR